MARHRGFTVPEHSHGRRGSAARHVSHLAPPRDVRYKNVSPFKTTFQPRTPSMSTTWFYEPFYEIDRLMNELVNQPDRARRTEPGDVAQRPYRPR